MNTTRKLSGLALALLVLAVPAAAFAARQEIFDWWRLRDYTPPQRVAALAADTAMNDYGRKLFYVNHPQLNGLDVFRRHCTESDASIVLGCFKNDEGIFIYDVQDPRLNGIHQVTAAHEMLHAGYERLSDSERERIDSLTAKTLSALDDERIRSTIDQYRRKDPGVVANELHSILGTEVKQLPVELEDYYDKYFSDRDRVVSYSEQYETEFTKRKNQIDAYDTQLSTLKREIENDEESLNGQLQDLQSSRRDLEALLSSGRREDYNAAVPGFNNRVSLYNQLVQNLQGKITRYNEIVIVRNDLAREIRDLTGALDTRVVPQPTH